MSEPVPPRPTQPQPAAQADQAATQLRRVAPKDLSLVSLIPKWSGADTAAPISRFFSAIENAARIGNWTDADQVQVCSLKLIDEAHEFYWATPELRDPVISWQEFKTRFLTRFRDVRPKQYHYNQLHLARQKKHETPREFLDRVRSLAEKTIPSAADPLLQQAHREAAHDRLLTSFTNGLFGLHGRQVRLVRPPTVEQALDIAENAIQVMAQEARDPAFYTYSEPPTVPPAARPQEPENKPTCSCNVHPQNRSRRQWGAPKPRKHGAANTSQSDTMPKCSACGGQGHSSSVCANTRQTEASDAQLGRRQGQGQRRPPPQDRLRHGAVRQVTKTSEN
jgi:hypothetical protein